MFLVCIFIRWILVFHTSRENMEMLYSPSLNGTEDIGSFLGAVLKRLKYHVLPCSPCWFCFYQDYTIRSSLTSHKLFSMQQLSYWTGSTVGLTSEPESCHRGEWCRHQRFPSGFFILGTQMQLFRSPCEWHASPELNDHIAKAKGYSYS